MGKLLIQRERGGFWGDCSPVGQCRKCSLSPARATVGGDVLVHLDGDGDGECDGEDAHRPGEIVSARDIPPIPLLGQLVVRHCF